jgi:hypothetical protein
LRAVKHQVTGLTGPDHRARRPMVRLGAVAGAVAAIAVVAIGAASLFRGHAGLLRGPATDPAARQSAQQITVQRPPPTIGLSAQQIAGLLHQRPDYGPLSDPWRRASCLNGLGYPSAAPVLGAQPVQIDDRPAVLLVLAADDPRSVVALVVPSDCSSVHTGLIADTQIARP